jgi:cystathionine beta-lyase/cystathionine gamma-synthase
MISADERKKMGVTEQMIRLAVGIESAEDLIADLARGISVLSGSRETAGAARR